MYRFPALLGALAYVLMPTRLFSLTYWVHSLYDMIALPSVSLMRFDPVPAPAAPDTVLFKEGELETHVYALVFCVLALCATVLAVAHLVMRYPTRYRAMRYELWDALKGGHWNVEASEYEYYVFERQVDGSEYFNTEAPRFQAEVEILSEGRWMKSGVATCTELGVITCFHVIAAASGTRLKFDGKYVEVEPSQWKHCEDVGDLVVANVKVQGMKQARLAKNTPSGENSTMVMIHNGKMASIGPLRSHTFGMVKYGGSTARGFSGAPYYMGNQVYGFHVGAESVNVGYDATFVKIANASYIEESSDAYYGELISQGVSHRVEVSKGNPDEVYVHIRGHYVLMDADDYYEYKDNKRVIRESLPRAIQVDFRDSENFEWPAVESSTAGLPLPKELSAEAITPQLNLPGTSSLSPESGTPKSSPPQGKTAVPPVKVLNTTSELMLESVAKTLVQLTNKLETLEALQAKAKTPLKRPRRKSSKPTSAPGTQTSTTSTQ